MGMKPCTIDSCVLFARSIIIQMLRMKFIFLFILITKGISELVERNQWNGWDGMNVKDRGVENKEMLDKLSKQID